MRMRIREIRECEEERRVKEEKRYSQRTISAEALRLYKELMDYEGKRKDD